MDEDVFRLREQNYTCKEIANYYKERGISISKSKDN